MPHNGEMNEKLGFYKNLCCGKEIFVRVGNQFPDCPNHRGLTTIWKPIVDDKIVNLGKARVNERATSPFQPGDRVSFVGFGRERGKQGSVIEVIGGGLDQVHRYHVQLNDGTLLRCFGFELELILTDASRRAS